MTTTCVQSKEMADHVAAEGWAIARHRLDADEVHNARTLISALGVRDVVFTGHSDAHHGFTQGWHKDIGSAALGDQLCGYFGESPESLFQEPSEVVKIGIYLQKSTSVNCLRVDPGSHLRPGLAPVRPTEVLMAAGDLVVFDVRITHAGAVVPDPDSQTSQTSQTSPESRQLAALRERISAFVTFSRNTRRAKKFARANMARQKRQIGLTEEEAMAHDHGHSALLASQGVLMWEGN